ncbi:phosphoric monoester hydrolase [Cryptococcus neoformans A2-102-5]|nr:phosphoric monoester hydrolase [Cryptococcus neoformans var. grubii D17-1]OXG95669.1 phosphoric monoester hydrolase [Cryptococcus neoformans var. grubii A2-102-5]
MATLHQYSPPPESDPDHEQEEHLTLPLYSEPHRPPALHHRPSFLDEIVPLPSPSHFTPVGKDPRTHALRRSMSVAIIGIFMLAVIFMASTESRSTAKDAAAELKGVFGIGSVAELGEIIADNLGLDDGEQSTTDDEGLAAEAGENSSTRPKIDFDMFRMIKSVDHKDLDLSSGHRVIFVGDVHSSYDPLQRLMSKLQYDDTSDVLFHVGDLLAKGPKPEQVLQWMREHKVRGVRGNHDQPVIQWRTWMEWAGGVEWEAYMDLLSTKEGEEAIHILGKDKKKYPDGWIWKGEHWNIARQISKESYEYLTNLSLILHFPSLHAFVVHGGLLPSNPLRSSFDASQPLVEYSNTTLSPPYRKAEELAIVKSIIQNTVPYNIYNMRSVFTKGPNKGQVTKSSTKGTPWSEVWNKEMKRCKGPGAWTTQDEGDEWQVEQEQVDDVQLENEEELDETVKRQKPGTPEAEKQKSAKKKLKCSPVTVIYGHAAGRGLDIKPFSKGIDTGCVYGRQLTALVLGDTTGLDGQSVRVGDHKGVLVSVDCGKHGT